MSLNSDIAVLAKIDLFSELNEEQLRLLAFGGEKMILPVGNQIFRDGEAADGGYVVTSGEVVVVHRISDTKSETQHVGTGGLLGELALITETKRIGTATVTQQAELLRIRREVMHRVLQEYPEVAARLHQKMSATVSRIAQELDRLHKQLASD